MPRLQSRECKGTLKKAVDRCRVICYTIPMKKKTSIYLDESDRKAIVVIKEAYGITSESDAIRLALRLIAEQIKERQSKS